MTLISRRFFPVLLLTLVALGGCGHKNHVATNPTAPAPIAQTVPAPAASAPDTGPPPPIAAGKPAPAITTRTVNGHSPLSLAKLKGHVVLVDYWATWCGPCQMATPTLQYLHKTYKYKGLTVLGMNVDQPDTQRNIKPFLAHFHMTYPVAVLSRANVQSAMAYKVEGIPSQYLIDKKGIVRWSQSGYSPYEGKPLEAMIQKLLAEKG